METLALCCLCNPAHSRYSTYTRAHFGIVLERWGAAVCELDAVESEVPTSGGVEEEVQRGGGALLAKDLLPFPVRVPFLLVQLFPRV